METVQHLLSLGVSVDVRGGSQNETPLLYASSMGSIEMATILLKHGADINARDEDNQTCLHTAAYYNHVAVVKLFLENNADIKARGVDKETPFHTAVAGNSKKVVQLYLNTMQTLKKGMNRIEHLFTLL